VKDVVDVAMMWKGSMGKPDGRRGGRGWIGEKLEVEVRERKRRVEERRREKKRE
jgi:hypothetical protein